MPIQVLLTSTEIICLDCGNIQHFLANLDFLKKESIFFKDGLPPCIMCKSPLVTANEVTRDLLVPTDLEISQGITPEMLNS